MGIGRRLLYSIQLLERVQGGECFMGLRERLVVLSCWNNRECGFCSGVGVSVDG